MDTLGTPTSGHAPAPSPGGGGDKAPAAPVTPMTILRGAKASGSQKGRVNFDMAGPDTPRGAGAAADPQHDTEGHQRGRQRHPPPGFGTPPVPADDLRPGATPPTQRLGASFSNNPLRATQSSESETQAGAAHPHAPPPQAAASGSPVEGNPNFSWAEWTPEMGLPGMEFDPKNVDDPVRSMKVLEMLQALDRTTEELMGQKVSNEELMGFLEMGEKRIVDLAVKVKLLEDQNERMALKDASQRETIEALREDLTQLGEAKQTSDQEKEVQACELSDLRESHADLRTLLDGVSVEKQRETERLIELRRLNDEQEEVLRKERERAESDKRVAAATVDRDKKRLNEKVEEWHRKSDINLGRAKQLEKELKDKTREGEKLQGELNNLQRQYKNERVRMDNELQNGKMTNQEEMVRLHTWDKELTELNDKLKKGEAKLEKEKENIKRSLGDAVKEIQGQRQAENQLLLDMKQQYEAELSAQFDMRQGELEDHWRQKEQLELEQLEERRNNLDAELQLKMQKASENRQRLERYSGNLERYGRRLKAEYENWQHEKQQVYAVLDEAQREREEIEEEHKVRVAELTGRNDTLVSEVQAKQAQLDTLSHQLSLVTGDRERLTQAQHESAIREDDLGKQIEQLTAENERLVEDNTLLEKNFNELKCEHDQLLEEMTYMRSREEEERELRRKTNEMLLASYKIKNPQTGMVMPMTTKSGQVVEGIDLLCWKCHQNVLEDEGSGLLARTKEARQQMQELAHERNLLQSEKEVFLKAHKLDAMKLTGETAAIREEREQLKRDTEKLIAERKAMSSVTNITPSLAQDREQQVRVARLDPDINPVDAVDAKPIIEPLTDSSRRRKKDLIFLKSIYSSPSVTRSAAVHGVHGVQGPVSPRWGSELLPSSIGSPTPKHSPHVIPAAT